MAYLFKKMAKKLREQKAFYAHFDEIMGNLGVTLFPPPASAMLHCKKGGRCIPSLHALSEIIRHM